MSNFSAISWREHVTFHWDDDDASHWTNTVSWIFIVLVHWTTCPQEDRSTHSDTLFWFWTNQTLLLLFSTAYLRPESIFGLTRLELMIYHIQGKLTNANHYITNVVHFRKRKSFGCQYVFQTEVSNAATQTTWHY